MEELTEYHKLVFLVDNFTTKGVERPIHVANTIKERLGHLGSIFVQLDDDALSILTNAQLVGANVSRDAEPLVIVI